MSLAVITRAYDNTRSGANTQETLLTPAAIRQRGIKRLFTLALPGDARGCEAQPLIAPGVTLADEYETRRRVCRDHGESGVCFRRQ